MGSLVNSSSRSKPDGNIYLPQDFDSHTEARCSSCDNLVNVHKWMEHKKECVITKILRCDLCSSDFNHEVNLKVHKLLKHSTSGKECIICKKKFQRDSAFRGHVVSHTVACDKIMCPVLQCEEDFDSPMELNRHRRLRHSDKAAMTEALICCYCGQIFSPFHLDTHQRTHIYERVLHKKIFSARKKSEKTSVKPAIRPHICSICEKAFRRPKELERHLSIHSETRNFKCAFCPMEFRHENVLQAHEKLHKKTNKVYKCRICQHNFNTRFNLHRHLQMTHTRKDSEERRNDKVVDEMEQLVNLHKNLPIDHQVGRFPDHMVDYVDGAVNVEVREETIGDDWGTISMEDQDTGVEQGGERWDLEAVTGCDLAEQLFENREHDKERMMVIPGNSLRCPACIHAVENIGQFMIHFQTLVKTDSLHRRIIFNCIFCREEISGVEVYSHLQSHGINPDERTIIPKRSVPRPHVCPSCQRTFTKKVDLTRHIRTHTGEKPFACRVCGERFRVETTLSRHQKTHIDTDATHECSLCGKDFLSRNALRIHMMTHATPCSLCHQTFKSVNERDEHTAREHSNREVGSRTRVGGMYLPSVPGGLATLSQISRPVAGACIVSTPSSAFHSFPSSSKDATRHLYLNVNVIAEDTTKEGMVMKLSRRQKDQEFDVRSTSSHPQHTSSSSSSLSFSVPHQLLSSLQMEKGVLRTHLNRGRVVNMHPSETLSAVDSVDRMDLHPVEAQCSQPYTASQCLRSSSFVPIDINSDNYFLDHCNICDVPLSTKEESTSHMNSEDHETAMLLTPHSGIESSSSGGMICKLCGNRFVSMTPLVEHIRVAHMRDANPKSLAPLNLHTSHLISSMNN